MQADLPSHIPPGYTVLGKLGAGQTAQVFLARHPEKGDVALKVPRPELAEQPVLRRMFENEVQITLKLQHRNVVGGVEGVPTGARAYLVLEYCPGGTLGELLDRGGQLSLDLARTLILQVARGLEHSHGRLVLHRDVKPANVFLGRDGTAKLGDFGTGTHIGSTYQQADDRDRVGTAFYMAPEIFEGQPATVRSDIYSLGILAYEVVAGVRPFSGSSYEDLLVAHTSGFPKALVHYREDLPRAESKVIATAMARDAGRRYRSVREFREALMEAAGIHEAVEEQPVPLTGRASRRPRPVEDDAADEDDARGSGGLLGWFRRRRD